MQINEILELVRAGYTKSEIDQMETSAAEPVSEPVETPADPPADPPAPEPQTEPAPISVGVAEQYDPAGLESLLRQVLGSVDGLKKTVQASQILTGVQEAPTGADALRTATMHAAGVFEPPAKK